LRRQGVLSHTAAHPLIAYRARPKECAACPLKASCCGEAEARTVTRPDDGGLRERTLAYLATPHARRRIGQRKVWVETIFGDGKERRGLRRARFRGLDRVRIQAYLIAIAQNVRQLATCRPVGPLSAAAGQDGGILAGAHARFPADSPESPGTYHKVALWPYLN
jgi:hypothetical protein